MRLKEILLVAAALAAGTAPAWAQTAVAPAPVSAPAPAAPIDVAATAPAAPDYSQASTWAAGAAGPGPAAALPKGATPAAAHPAVDVFYVHPTTTRSDRLWNQDIADAAANRWVDESVVARQASPFSGCCRIFAPRYRAATYQALMNGAARDAAFALAYSDVERAFDWYLAHENHGRPFIIVGHSQGAFHIATLLEKRIDGSPALRKRLVAAYIIGVNLGEGEFGLRYKHVGICNTPAQTGCAVQWNAVLRSADLPLAARRAQQTYVDKYGDGPGKLTLCVNPLTFDRRRPVAPAGAALGAVPGAPGFGALQPLRAHAVAARCDSGMLVVEPAADLGLEPLPGGVMHYHDVGLFYADIRANAALRARTFMQARGARR